MHLGNELTVARFWVWTWALWFRPSGETKAEENEISSGLYLGSKLKWRLGGSGLGAQSRDKEHGSGGNGEEEDWGFDLI